ncbi:MAG TPA: carbon-nitrogen hydrolase family protein [Streptosporangiaceae bacterium]|nr:carbon-nitrogen hydrolase family protein [Streptosporangiaceae bacterium]
MRDEVTVGIAQWLPAPGRHGENLRTALSLIGDLAARGADLVVLPELWPSGYDVGTLGADARAAAEPLLGPRTTALAARSRELGIWLAAGSVPESDAGSLYNTALLFDRQGELRAWHRKARLYAPLGEDAIFTAGHQLTTCQTDEFGIVGLCVCFDADFPQTARALRRAGASLVLLPAAYEDAAATWWRTLYPAHALSNGQWWVMANQCGENPSGCLLGESQVIAPSGEIVARGRTITRGEAREPECLIVRLDLRSQIEQAAEENGVLWMSPDAELPVHVF